MILAAILLAAFQITPELRHHVDAGLKAKRAGNLDAAIREFQRAVELAPTLPAAHMNLGAVYFDKKDYARALPALGKALELNPDLPGAHAMIGTALLAQGYPAQAIPHLEKAQTPELLGIALLEAGRPREAIDKLEAALQNRLNDPDLLYYLSHAHGQLSKQVFDNLAGGYPDSPRTQQIRGEAYTAAGNREAAEKSFRAALDQRPDLRGIHFALGELALAAGDYETAEREFRSEAALVPGSAAAAYKLGFVLANRGDTKAALAEFQRADTLQPGMPETLLELGKMTAAAGEYSAAVTLFQRVLELERRSDLAAAAHFQLAEAFRKMGRAEDAARERKLFQELRKPTP